MDYQSGIVAGGVGDKADKLLSKAAETLATARATGMQVIYIQVGFREGFPEISPKNAMFGAVINDPQRRRMFEGPMKDIHPAVEPQSGDIVVTKHRVSGFHGTDLYMILRAKEIDTLVLFGIATSGVVLSTLTCAADADYKLFVIEDLCADGDQELHASLMKYYARRGTVISSTEFTEAVSK